MENIVSIVIPSFNRSPLLGGTLDSILGQTYSHWECIVVDDGSTDYTNELLEFYCEKDSRIQFFSRPKDRKKGANACRNFGFEKSKGEFIQFFDSDDLMVATFLERKMIALHDSKKDYVISKAANFCDPNPSNILHKNESYYQFDKYEISNYNFVSQKINWLTYDFITYRKYLVGLKFNENLSSGQEYNFFCKFTTLDLKPFVMDEYLTLRRVHQDSIRGKINKDGLKKIERLKVRLETWRDMANLKPGSKSEIFFLINLVKQGDPSNPSFKVLKFLASNLFKQKRFKALFYLTLLKIAKQLIGRSYFLREQFIKSVVYRS